MDTPRIPAAFDVVRVVDTLAAIVQAASMEPVSTRRTAILRQLDRLAAEFLHLPGHAAGGDVLDRFASWSHRLEDHATKCRVAAVLSHCARFLGRNGLADRLRIRALNQAELVPDPAECARLVIGVVDQLADVDQDEALREAARRAEHMVHELPESEVRRELTVAVAHALAAVGEAQEAANELQMALLPGSTPFVNGDHLSAPVNGQPVFETAEGRFTDPTAGLVAPRPHRHPR